MKLTKQITFWAILMSFLLTSSAQAETYYYHNDHLGTPQVLTDQSQSVVWQGEYDPFGEVTETIAVVEQNLRFPGQYFDQETGLHYNYFRTYDPSLGRYVQSDPIGLNGGTNTFGYVMGNPVLLIDFYGLAVGDWWDFYSNLKRAREISVEELRKRPSAHNDFNDGMRHAEWQRRTTEETNACVAWIAGTGHELTGLFEGQPVGEALMDLHNNSIGREAGSRGSPIKVNEIYTLPQTELVYRLYPF